MIYLKPYADWEYHAKALQMRQTTEQEDMMNRTEGRILDEFAVLLREKPFRQITVRNIIERCDINHNTFYYYFHNIRELWSRLLERAADRVVEECAGEPVTHQKFLNLSIDYLTKHRDIVMNAYHSLDTATFSESVGGFGRRVSECYVEKNPNLANFTEQEKEDYIWYLATIFTGLTINWLAHDMDYDLSARIERLIRLYQKHQI